MTVEQEIRSEIYLAFERLGADRELLAAIGSWGDTLDHKAVLTLLKESNAGSSPDSPKTVAKNTFAYRSPIVEIGDCATREDQLRKGIRLAEYSLPEVRA